MALALDATSVATQVTASSLTWAHTCTGSDLILFAGCGIPTANTITGATYNGVAMTIIDSIALTAGRWTSLLYIASPATGTHNIVVSSSASDILQGAAASYTGSNGTINATTKSVADINSAASLTETLTTTVDNCWLIMVNEMVGSPVSAGASTTLRASLSTGNALFDSNGAKSPAGSYSLAAVNGDSVTRNMTGIMAAFAPGTQSSSKPFFFGQL